jgi:hypothetical protein
MLCRDGWAVNAKRVYRFYCELGRVPINPATSCDW